MMKTILSSIGMLAFVGSLNAQEAHKFDPTNARDGENVEYCTTHKKRQEILQNHPEAAAIFAQDAAMRVQEESQPHAEIQAVTRYVPIVFHLLHNNGTEKISDDQIYDAFEILNRDYDLQNSDAANVVNAFNATNPSAIATPTDVDIQFRLATIAPDGTCFSGITHTVHSITDNGSNGNSQVNAIVSGNDVYNGQWPPSEYLNVYICGDIGGAAGYTFNPSNFNGASMFYNGIFVLHNYTGSFGTSSASSSRTLTHEVGHWLNLSHTWGPNNNPGNASSCNDDDGVDDTPRCIGLTACNLVANSCSPDPGDDDWGGDEIDNAENYMDYSYCSKMFTQGQVDRMRNALESNIADRNDLYTTANLNATGANGTLYLCRAEFSADKTTVCAGESVQFSDESFNDVSGWTWTFAGGTPAGSSSSDPLVTYDTPGLYEVVLQATDGTNNDTETKTSYIRVLPAGVSVPFNEGFEAFTTLADQPEWEVYDAGNNAKWDITTSAFHSGARSAKLANFGQSAGNVDELASSPIDLSTISSPTNMTLTFRYAYRKRSSGNDEYLKVLVTNDCGDDWVVRKTMFSDVISDQVSTSSWTPTDINDWTTVHMTNVTSSYWVDNFRYKFRFESDGGNNFYLDDINLYPGSPQFDIVVGLEGNTKFEGLSVYPNPTEDELNVKFSLGSAQQVTFNVQDVTGKVVQSNLVNANSGANVVMMDVNSLATGMYLLNIITGTTQETVQFVVK